MQFPQVREGLSDTDSISELQHHNKPKSGPELQTKKIPATKVCKMNPEMLFIYL